MGTGTVIGGLYLPDFVPADRGAAMNRGIAGARQQVQGQTDLVQLAELERAQQQAAAEREFMAQNYQMFAGQGQAPQSYLGGAGLPQAPMTQQTFGAGVPASAPMPVPGGQDLSQFATQGAPGQSVLGQPGPQQGPQHDPMQNLWRTNPAAAQAIQARLEKMQDMRLDRTIKEAEYVGRVLQGVGDETTYQPAKAEIARVLPQLAAQLPATYSKEGIKPFQDRALSVGERAKVDLDVASTLKKIQEAQNIPRMAEIIEREERPSAPAAPGTPAPGAPGPTSQPARGQAPAENEHTRLIRAEAIRQDVDPDLAVAVATQESSLSPDAKGDGGKSLGYFQLQPGAAQDVGIDPARRHEPALNIQGGVAYLKKKLAQTKGNVDEALKLYNGGGDPNYVANVRRFYPGGSGTGTAHAPAAHPLIAELDDRIPRVERQAQAAANMGNESLATQYHHKASRLKEERTRLQDEDRRRQEQATALPRKLEEQQALEPGDIRRREAAARIQNEAKMNEPIGIQAGDELDLPASTKWKDVPPDRKAMPRPGEGERKGLSDLRAGAAGVDSLLTKLDDPKIAGMIGTIFTAPMASIDRVLSPWLSTLAPEQREFAAGLAREIMEVRHRLIGAGQTGIEVEALTPMMPGVDDTDPATVRAKLKAMREGITLRHDAKRDDLAGYGFRVPAKLGAAPASSSGLTAAQEALINKHRTP